MRSSLGRFIDCQHLHAAINKTRWSFATLPGVGSSAMKRNELRREGCGKDDNSLVVAVYPERFYRFSFSAAARKFLFYLLAELVDNSTRCSSVPRFHGGKSQLENFLKKRMKMKNPPTPAQQRERESRRDEISFCAMR